jgi:GTPase SAR1 family protein
VSDENLQRMSIASYARARAIIFCFDLSDRKSFDDIEKVWDDGREQIRLKDLPRPAPKHPLHYANEGVPMILAGLKGDMSATVTDKEANETAIKFGAMCYMSCSAKSFNGVQELIEKAALAAAAYNPPDRNPKKKKKCTLM